MASSAVSEKSIGDGAIHTNLDHNQMETESEKGPDHVAGMVVATSNIPPEEGVRGWICVLGAFLTVSASFGFLNASVKHSPPWFQRILNNIRSSVGVFQAYYQEDYLEHYTPSEISWIFSFQIASMWIPGPLIGRVVDTYGPAPILYPSSLLCILGLCLTSISRSYPAIFFSQGVCFGLGAGGVFTSSFICVGQWFVRRRGFAVGIASVGSSLGGIYFPQMVWKLVQRVGFPGAVRYTALLEGILLLVGCGLVRARLPRKKWDGKGKWVEVKMLKEGQFAFFTWGSFFAMWGLWAPFDFISSSALAQGFSFEMAISLISLVNATSVLSRLIPTYLADRLGHFNVTMISAYSIGLSILCLWLPFGLHPSHAGLIVFALVYGMVSGAFVSLLIPCVAKTGPIETIGMRFGTFQLVVGIACLTGLPISGAILAKQGGVTFWGLQTFATISSLLGAAMITVSAVLLGRAKGTWRI